MMNITLKIIGREKSIITSEPNGGSGRTRASEPNGGGRIGGGSSNDPTDT